MRESAAAKTEGCQGDGPAPSSNGDSADAKPIVMVAQFLFPHGEWAVAKTKSEILDDFQAFMGRHGGNYREWYVGTAADARQQMFSVHKFKAGDKGLYRQALSELQAAEVAEFFTNLGAKGNPAPTRDAEFVYAYKRAGHTKP